MAARPKRTIDKPARYRTTDTIPLATEQEVVEIAHEETPARKRARRMRPEVGTVLCVLEERDTSRGREFHVRWMCEDGQRFPPSWEHQDNISAGTLAAWERYKCIRALYRSPDPLGTCVLLLPSQSSLAVLPGLAAQLRTSISSWVQTWLARKAGCAKEMRGTIKNTFTGVSPATFLAVFHRAMDPDADEAAVVMWPSWALRLSLSELRACIDDTDISVPAGAALSAWLVASGPLGRHVWVSPWERKQIRITFVQDAVTTRLSHKECPRCLYSGNIDRECDRSVL